MVVTIDTLRADRLGVYGYFRPTSPVFDHLARDSVLLERCYAPMATTFPSHLSLFTGAWPGEVGALANVGVGGAPFVASPRLRTLAEILAEKGYQTGGFVSAAPLKDYSGIHAGFEHFDQPEGDQRTARETNHEVVQWLATVDPLRPLFLWVHYFEPHAPYAPDPSVELPPADEGQIVQYLAERRLDAGTDAATREQQNLYDIEVRSADRALGELLEALPGRVDREQDLLVVAGDHGEGLGQHGELEHGGLWSEQLRVPLLIRAPGRGPARISEPVALIDLLVILLGLSDLPGRDEILAQSAGRDALAGDAPTPVFSQESGAPWRVADGAPPRVALTGPRYKLIHDPATTDSAIDSTASDITAADQLFDLHQDPHELRNLAAELPEVVEEMRQILRAQLDQQRRRRARFFEGRLQPQPETDPEIEEQLRSLGYL